MVQPIASGSGESTSIRKPGSWKIACRNSPITSAPRKAGSAKAAIRAGRMRPAALRRSRQRPARSHAPVTASAAKPVEHTSSRPIGRRASSVIQPARDCAATIASGATTTNANAISTVAAASGVTARPDAGARTRRLARQCCRPYQPSPTKHRALHEHGTERGAKRLAER